MRTSERLDRLSASLADFAPIKSLADALINPARRERTVLLLLVAYAAVWTLYGVIAKSNQDIQFDAAELVTWSQHLALGYTKHPPFGAWLVHAWFSLLPFRDWSYYLLAMIYAAFALWIGWRLFARYLDVGKRIVALACLTLIPCFNFHGLRFDENAVLGPLWAAATLCFIRSFDSRSKVWSVLAGATAALAMLGKYWSIFLLAGMALAALLDQRRAAYFRSAAPWITTVVGLVVLSPHFIWLVTHDFIPFSYAVDAHKVEFVKSLRAAASYLAGGAGYAAVPTLLVLILCRPGRAALIDMLLPRQPERRFAAIIFWTVLLLPAVVALVFRLELSPIWSMTGFILLPVVLLSSPLVTLQRQALTTTLALVVALPLIMLALSPAIAIVIHIAGVTPMSAHAKLLAERIEQEWRKSTDRPLRIVGGDLDLAYMTVFYLGERPAAYPATEPENTPWVTPADIARNGIALTCNVYTLGSEHCREVVMNTAITNIASRFPHARRIEIELSRSFLGIPGKPAHYVIVIAPPEPNYPPPTSRP